MIRYIAIADFLLLACSVSLMLLSIIRPDLRTWPRPKTTRWPRRVLAIVGQAMPLGLLGLLLLGVLDSNSLGLGVLPRIVGGVQASTRP